MRPTRVSIYDHDRSLFYVNPRAGIKRLNEIRDRLGVSGGSVSGDHRHIFIDVVDDFQYLDPWFNKIRKIPDWFLDSICEETLRTGPLRAEIEALKSFLKYRKDNIGDILNANRKEFTAIKNWPMFP